MEADGLEGVVGTIMDHHMDHQTAHLLLKCPRLALSSWCFSW